MAIMQIKDIDKDLFWEMAEKAESYEIHVVDDYLRMLTDKLKEDTDIDFRVENYSLVNKQLGISIPSSEIKGYDSLLKKIDDSLSASSVDNPYDVDTNKLVNEWGYSFSDTGMTPYYETSKRRWHAYDEYSQSRVFEAFYFGVFGKYHNDLGFAHDLGKKYLVQDSWKEKYHYKGSISELKGLEVTFAKNGNISVKTNDREFWERIDWWYNMCDPKFKNHER